MPVRLESSRIVFVKFQERVRAPPVFITRVRFKNEYLRRIGNHLKSCDLDESWFEELVGRECGATADEKSLNTQ